MTKSAAIALARQKCTQHLGTFRQLTPYKLWNGQWAVACHLTKLVGWTVTDPATFDSDLQSILAAGPWWYREVHEFTA